MMKFHVYWSYNQLFSHFPLPPHQCCFFMKIYHFGKINHRSKCSLNIVNGGGGNFQMDLVKYKIFSSILQRIVGQFLTKESTSMMKMGTLYTQHPNKSIHIWNCHNTHIIKTNIFALGWVTSSRDVIKIIIF